MKNHFVLDIGSINSKFRVNGNMVRIEPTFVLYSCWEGQERTMAGKKAKHWAERMPGGKSICPISHGIITDYNILACFFKEMRNIAARSLPFYRRLLPWRYTVIIPNNWTVREEEYFSDFLRQNKVSNCTIVKAHAVFKGENELIFDLGAGVSTVMAFKKGHLTGYESEYYGSGDLDVAIQALMQEKHSCTISPKLAETLKNSYMLTDCQVYGSHIVTRFPLRFAVPGNEIREVVDRSYIAAIRDLVSRVRDKYRDGVFDKILLTGGGARQKGLKESLEKTFGLPVEIAPNAETFLIDSIGGC